MIQLHQTVSTTLHPECIRVNSPICVFDPYDNVKEDDENLTEINVKQGGWMACSGLFRQACTKHNWHLRTFALETALVMLKPVTTQEQLGLLKELHRNHLDTCTGSYDALKATYSNKPDTLALLDLVTKDKPFPLNTYEDLDQTKYRIFSLALSYIGGSKVSLDNLILSLHAQAEKKSQAEIKAIENGEILGIIAEITKSLALENSEHETNLLCQVQFLHLKHESQPIFSPSGLFFWEAAEYRYTSSGQIALTTKAWLDSTTEDDIACQIELMTKQYEEDCTRTRLNKKKVGASEFGAACVTPERESGNTIWVMKNEQGEIVELLIHFDLDFDDE